MPPEIAQLIFWLEGKDFVIFNQIDSIFFVFWGLYACMDPAADGTHSFIPSKTNFWLRPW